MEMDSQDKKESFELVSIAIPTYKEVQNLRPLIERIADTMSPLSSQYEIIVVDDDSRDGTEEIISELIAEGNPVKLITRIGERGLSSAVIRGFKECRGEILVCMDADLSHQPEAIPGFLTELRSQNADFVLGSRYVVGGSTQKNWGNYYTGFL